MAECIRRRMTVSFVNQMGALRLAVGSMRFLLARTEALRFGTYEPVVLISGSLGQEPDMSISDQMSCLADELRTGALHARTEILAFPSGNIWLDVHFADRMFTIAYLSPERCFGVDEATIEEHGIGTHFCFSFPDFESAKAKLLDLLDEAQATLARAQKSKALT
jgi:hypothetical protein